MGIRTYVTAYTEVEDVCLGKTSLLSNWMADHGICDTGETFNGYIILDDYYIDELLKDIDYVLTAEDKLKAFNEKFKEESYYTDYEGWLEDDLVKLSDLKLFLQKFQGKSITLFVGEW